MLHHDAHKLELYMPTALSILPSNMFAKFCTCNIMMQPYCFKKEFFNYKFRKIKMVWLVVVRCIFWHKLVLQLQLVAWTKGQVRWTSPTHPPIEEKNGWHHLLLHNVSPCGATCSSILHIFISPPTYLRWVHRVGKYLQVPHGRSHHQGHSSKLTHSWTSTIMGWVPRGLMVLLINVL